MFPSVTSTYLQYKEDTNRVASWLAKTAKSYGYPADILHPSEISTNKKPKNKKKPRGKHNKKPKPKPAVAAKYIIAVEDFATLAAYIAGLPEPSIKVPNDIFDSLDRAIDLRKSYSLKMINVRPRGSESESDTDLDESHLYFVRILENVRKILLPCRSSSEADDDRQERPKKDGPSSMFAGLEVHEPSEEFLRAPDIIIPKAEQITEEEYISGVLDNVAEVIFLFDLLLRDTEEIRYFVLQTWLMVKDGQYDLVSAAIMTNTAIDLVRRLEEDLGPIFDDYGGPDRFYEAFVHATTMQAGYSCVSRERPEYYYYNIEAYDVYNDHYFTPFRMMQAFRELVVKPGFVPQYIPGYFGSYDFSTWRSKSNRQKYAEDKAFTMELLPEFFIACMAISDLPVQDELIRGLSILFKDRTAKFPFWLTFAAQILLDINHLLGNDVAIGLKELQREASLISATINDTLEFHKDYPTTTLWPEANNKTLRSFLGFIRKVVTEDCMFDKRRRLYKQVDPGSADFKLFKHHPVLCGLILYHLRMQFHEFGLTFVEAWGSVIYTDHLYNAVCQEDILKSEWKDMDLFNGFQGGNIFVGNPPNTRDGYLKAFHYTAGGSVANIFGAKRNPGKRLQHSIKGPKGLSRKGPVSQMFNHRYCENSGRVDLTFEDVKKILSSAGLAEDPSHKSVRAKELLLGLLDAVFKEKNDIIFDYFLMHRSCWDLLRRVNDFCEGMLHVTFGQGYLEKEEQLPFVVGYIFLSIQKAELVKRRMYMDEDITTVLLNQAGVKLRDMIESGRGSQASNKLEQWGMPYVKEDGADSDSGSELENGREVGCQHREAGEESDDGYETLGEMEVGIDERILELMRNMPPEALGDIDNIQRMLELL